MVRIGLQRAFIPDLRDLVVTEFAIGVADQIGDIGIVVMTERPELFDRRGVVVAIVDGVVGRTIALNEGGIAEERLLGPLLGRMSRRAAVGRPRPAPVLRGRGGGGGTMTGLLIANSPSHGNRRTRRR